MEISYQQIQDFITTNSSPEDDLLKQITTETHQQHSHAHMMSNQVQGVLFEILSKSLQPKRILEIGTFTGYATIALSKGLQSNGKIHTIELREDVAMMAKTNFQKTPYPEKFILHIGDALNIIPTLDEKWDIVFMDADKTPQIEYFDLCIDRLTDKGIILVDNIFFHGSTLEQEVKGKNAKAILDFVEYLNKREDILKIILPLRDGLFLIRKK